MATEAIEKLEAAATAAVEKAKQLVGFERPASPGEDNVDSKSITYDVKEIAQDATSEAKEERTKPESEPRSSSPALSRQSTAGRETSPPKPSKIPRAISRGRSPAKKLAPQANGTSAKRSKTPDPIHEDRRESQEHSTNTNSQIPHPKPHSTQYRSPPPTTKTLAKKIEEGDAPEFSEVAKEAPAATAGASEDAEENGGKQRRGHRLPELSQSEWEKLPAPMEDIMANMNPAEPMVWRDADRRPSDDEAVIDDSS
jgi:hypothetical protein